MRQPKYILGDVVIYKGQQARVIEAWVASAEWIYEIRYNDYDPGGRTESIGENEIERLVR